MAVANANPDPRLATAQAAGALGGIPRINARIFAEVAKVSYIAVMKSSVRLGDFWSEGGDEMVEPDGLDALALVAAVRLEGVRLSLALSRSHALIEGRAVGAIGKAAYVDIAVRLFEAELDEELAAKVPSRGSRFFRAPGGCHAPRLSNRQSYHRRGLP